METPIALLDVLLQHTPESQIISASGFLSRLALVCPLPSRRHASSSSNAGHTQDLLLDVQRQVTAEGSGVTGCALAYPSCLVLLLEGQQLKGMLQKLIATGLVHGLDSKVLLSLDGLPERCCKSLFSAAVPSSSSIEAAEAADPAMVARLASSVVAKLRRIGSSLSALSEADARRHTQSLAAYHEGELPLPEVLLALAASPELPTAQEFLAAFSPACEGDLLPDQEREWPVAQPVVMGHCC